ncbi:hypothetical protein [Parasphingorhabdus sp.]|uniref:hypothetical protein n=1 Tax=Parasphingorhabdus sp. TaxID=2709688 RepID=UPI003A932D83
MSPWQKAIGQIFSSAIGSSGQAICSGTDSIAKQPAIFLSGSPLRHNTTIFLMVGIGLLTMFMIDFADLSHIARRAAGCLGQYGSIISGMAGYLIAQYPVNMREQSTALTD